MISDKECKEICLFPRPLLSYLPVLDFVTLLLLLLYFIVANFPFFWQEGGEVFKPDPLVGFLRSGGAILLKLKRGLVSR